MRVDESSAFNQVFSQFEIHYRDPESRSLQLFTDEPENLKTKPVTPPKSPPKVRVARGEILWKKTEVVNGSKGFQSPQMTRLSFAL
jgi:hypothetical protein